MLEGNRWLKGTLTQTAWAATRTKGTYLSAQYHRLAGRRGKKRAVIAVGHSQLVRAYHMIGQQVDYHDLGAAYFDTLERDRRAKHLVRRLEAMGYHVTIGEAA